MRENSKKKPNLKWLYLATPVIAVSLIFSGNFYEMIAGKSTIEPSGERTGSYLAVLRVNGYVYRSAGIKNQKEYTLNAEIGKIKKRVPAEVTPKANLVSNYLDEGTSIYSVKKNRNVLLAETKEKGVYELFKKTTIDW